MDRSLVIQIRPGISVVRLGSTEPVNHRGVHFEVSTLRHVWAMGKASYSVVLKPI